METKKVVVFDLDDTLLYEIEFLKSAYREIARKVEGENWSSLYQRMLEWYVDGKNVFDQLILENSTLNKKKLLNIYRNHFPEIKLNDGAIDVLLFCKNNGYVLGLISDGRSITQRNKLKATSILTFFDKIIISEEFGSEKPNMSNYQIFNDYKAETYYYVGDNPKKDFITPKKMGWKTFCLKDKGHNIHSQCIDLPKEFLPDKYIMSLNELIELL